MKNKSILRLCVLAASVLCAGGLSADDTYKVTVNTTGCSQSRTDDYPAGTEITFKAQPSSGFRFDHWSNGSTDNPYTVRITQDTALSAVFTELPPTPQEPDPVILPVPTYHLVIGSDNCNQVSANDYPQGSTFTFTAKPQTGWIFRQWSDGNTDNPRTLTLTQDSVLTAVFDLLPTTEHHVIIRANDCGEQWEGDCLHRTEITLNAEPESGYKFSHWSDGNTDNPRQVIVIANATFIAVFEKNELPSDIILQENESSDYYTQFAQDYNGQRVNTATLNRQFTQGKWATLCLPFNVNKAMMMALGLYNRVFAFRYAQQLDDETIQVFFTPAQSIEAGKGYIVNPNVKLAAKTSFVFPNVTINTDSDNGDITSLTGYNDGTGRGNLYLVGTLRTGTLQGTTSGTSIRAYRGFFRSDIPVNAQRVRIIADGETVTELEVMNGEEDLHEALPARKYIRNGLLFIERNGVTYTAQGQRID
ncbi:MAG: hypothetical protein IJ621_06880 [Paludibacteraceae bacterium]|nr:hypothetical protein [Paludibacteraceae bacterium]